MSNLATGMEFHMAEMRRLENAGRLLSRNPVQLTVCRALDITVEAAVLPAAYLLLAAR